MRGYGYEPGPIWKTSPEEDYGPSADKGTRENAPAVVFGQIGLILVIALGFALAVNLALFTFNIG